MEIVEQVGEIVAQTLQVCVDKGVLQLESLPEKPPVEKPKNPEHGDFATSICLQLAKPARMNPRQIAQQFLVHLTDPNGIIEQCDIAGPGFINFTVRPEVWRETAREIAEIGDSFGHSTMGAGQRVLVEFVSANPTGPLHVGHGRGAVTGDAVASLLQATGYQVDREYYINDVGNQMNILGRSLAIRYQQLCGKEIEFPENHYQGDYVQQIAASFRSEYGDDLVEQDYETSPQPFRDFIKTQILGEIQGTLAGLGIKFDQWFSEQSLHDSGRVKGVVEDLKTRDKVRVDDEGRVWFNSTAYGDDEDRVVLRDTGVPTYFAADIAYHDEKLSREYDLCINVWGADHHGYIARVKASLEALGHDPKRLEILLYQFVSLVENGAPVRMSTRGGVFETLDDLIEEVGADATRFNFLNRKSDAQFEFDLGLAKSQSMDNPVYYVQYGHARICQVLAKALEAGHSVPAADSVDLSTLVLPEEIAMLKTALDYPWTVRSAAKARSPHYVIAYLQDLIGRFHSYYSRYKHTEKVVSDDAKKTQARIFMCHCLKIVLANALALLGVSAPEKMYFTE